MQTQPVSNRRPAEDRTMKVTIFAATGGIGRQLLAQAVARHDDVTAVARNPNKLSAEARIVTADLEAADRAVLESAVEGADAVLSGLGARTNSEIGVAERGTRAIIEAMKATDVRRIVVVSAAPIGTVPGRAAQPRRRTTRVTGSSCGTCSAGS